MQIKRRTKLQLSLKSKGLHVLSTARRSIIHGRGRQRAFNIRNKHEYAEWIKYNEPRLYVTERESVFWKTITSSYPKFRRGVPYFVIEGKPDLYPDTKYGQPIDWFLAHGIYFVKSPPKNLFKSEQKRQKMVEILLDHEIREEVLEKAGYSPKPAHSIALFKERKDLERANLLTEFLSWLKEDFPHIYAERIKRWKLNKIPKAGSVKNSVDFLIFCIFVKLRLIILRQFWFFHFLKF